ncbi:MAG: hypothetical protein LBE62_02380 [Azonexus sp.]|jgi:hypothetical protein|nr:hypothetical protein [Azonexus sp.]
MTSQKSTALLFSPYTGHVINQPHATNENEGWFFCQNGCHNPPGFIDAPEWIPSGSVRLEAYGGTFCLVVSDIQRGMAAA